MKKERIRNSKMGTGYKGIRTLQHVDVFKIFDHFFEENPNIEQIIEIGTSFGGLSLYLHEKAKEIGSTFVTYDIKNKNSIPRSAGVDARQLDVLSKAGISEIGKMLGENKKTLLLCDGGDKAKEVNTFADYLDKGDIIMAHDYAPDRKFFENFMVNRVWNWDEIIDEDIEKTVIRNVLAYHNHAFEFLSVAWLCRIKNG